MRNAEGEGDGEGDTEGDTEGEGDGDGEEKWVYECKCRYWTEVDDGYDGDWEE